MIFRQDIDSLSFFENAKTYKAKKEFYNYLISLKQPIQSVKGSITQCYPFVFFFSVSFPLSSHYPMRLSQNKLRSKFPIKSKSLQSLTTHGLAQIGV